MYMMLRTALIAVLLMAGSAAADTVLHMTSEPGDYIGQGNDYTITLDTHTFNANRNYDNGVSFYCHHLGGLKPPPLGGSFSIVLYQARSALPRDSFGCKRMASH